MVNIFIYDNDGNKKYLFRGMRLDKAYEILEKAVLENDDVVLLEKSATEVCYQTEK